MLERVFERVFERALGIVFEGVFERVLDEKVTERSFFLGRGASVGGALLRGDPPVAPLYETNELN